MAFLARNLLFGQEATSASSAEEEIAPTPLPDTRREPCAREGCEKRATRTLQTRRNPPQSRGGGRKGSYTGDSHSRDERGGGGRTGRHLGGCGAAAIRTTPPPERAGHLDAPSPKAPAVRGARSPTPPQPGAYRRSGASAIRAAPSRASRPPGAHRLPALSLPGAHRRSGAAAIRAAPSSERAGHLDAPPPSAPPRRPEHIASQRLLSLGRAASQRLRDPAPPQPGTRRLPTPPQSGARRHLGVLPSGAHRFPTPPLPGAYRRSGAAAIRGTPPPKAPATRGTPLPGA